MGCLGVCRCDIIDAGAEERKRLDLRVISACTADIFDTDKMYTMIGIK